MGNYPARVSIIFAAKQQRAPSEVPVKPPQNGDPSANSGQALRHPLP